jgi:hypothetical protein
MSKEHFHCGIDLKDFEPYEFFCPCCGRERMDKQTLLRVQRVRSRYNKRLQIVKGGGWRCENYEPSETSAHREGKAVDLGYPIEDHWLMVVLGIFAGFHGIGDKCKGGRWQLHLDDAEEIIGVRPRPWKWTYT